VQEFGSRGFSGHILHARHAAAGSGSDDVWAVDGDMAHSNGTVLRWNGTSWQVVR
jgi:hypothetical protein